MQALADAVPEAPALEVRLSQSRGRARAGFITRLIAWSFDWIVTVILTLGYFFHRDEQRLHDALSQRAVVRKPVLDSEVAALRVIRRIRIGQARTGQIVKVAGEVELTAAPLVAPVTKRACALYLLAVQKRANDGRWVDVLRKKRAHTFRVRDRSGVVIIYPSSARVTLEGVPWVELSSAEIAPVLAAAGQFVREGDLFRYQECRLEEGHLVAAVGVIGAEPAPKMAAANYREPAHQRLTLGEDGATRVRITTDPGAIDDLD